MRAVPRPGPARLLAALRLRPRLHRPFSAAAADEPVLLLRRARPVCAHAARWERARLLWLATGSTVAPEPPSTRQGAVAPPSASDDDAADAADEAAPRLLLLRVEEERAARRRPRAKPVRIREQNILSALREPHRLVEFNRGLPLPRMVELIRTLWAEQAPALAAAVAPAVGEPPALT